MLASLRRHWPEYLIEAWALGTFMFSAAVFGTAMEHPDSPIRGWLPDATMRRILMGFAMGGTAIALIYSPWGQRSGAHMNPATTLAFLRLGKIKPYDALFYSVAQFIGGIAGLCLAKGVLGRWLAHPAVNYVVTVPGREGASVAFVAELLMAAMMMLMVLLVTNRPAIARYTGIFAGALVCLFITCEAPYSGMSMNPARTTASAVPSGVWTAVWLYYTAPFGGMLLATQAYLFAINPTPRACPKLHHGHRQRCIFCKDAPPAATNLP